MRARAGGVPTIVFCPSLTRFCHPSLTTHHMHFIISLFPISQPVSSTPPPSSTISSLPSSRRPGIEEVGGLIVGQIMTQLERVSISEQRLAKALTLERAQRRGGEGGPGSPARLAVTPAHVR